MKTEDSCLNDVFIISQLYSSKKIDYCYCS